VSEKDNGPVRVTGEERRHPAIRQLARACIELARLRLMRQVPPGDATAAQQESDSGEEGAPRG
jgi:hypothetical protein